MANLGFTSLMISSYGHTAWIIAKRSASTHQVRSSGLLGPAVRNLLEHYAITSEKIQGSGPKGVILKGDVLSLIQNQKLKPKTATIPLPVSGGIAAFPAKTLAPAGKPGPKDSRGRIKYFDVPVAQDIKETASAVVKGKTAVPHGYLYATCRVDEAEILFAESKENRKDKIPVHLADVIVRAAIAAAQKYLTQADSRGKDFDIAVQAFKEGKLESRMLKQANGLRIKDIGKQLLESPKIDQTKTNQIPFRIVSLIGSRLDQITEVLTPTQSWVLSIGDALTRIDAQTKMSSKIVTLSFTYNAATISEDSASSFLDNVKSSIERPVFILLGAGLPRPQKDAEGTDIL